jgi:hypothetical protein
MYNIFMEGTGDARLGWNAGFSQCSTGGRVNDVDFTRAVALWMIEHLCVDATRLFVRCAFFDQFAAPPWH